MTNKGVTYERVTDERLDTLIEYAEACSKPWIGVDVVSALRELRLLRIAVEPNADCLHKDPATPGSTLERLDGYQCVKCRQGFDLCEPLLRTNDA